MAGEESMRSYTRKGLMYVWLSTFELCILQMHYILLYIQNVFYMCILMSIIYMLYKYIVSVYYNIYYTKSNIFKEFSIF